MLGSSFFGFVKRVEAVQSGVVPALFAGWDELSLCDDQVPGVRPIYVWRVMVTFPPHPVRRRTSVLGEDNDIKARVHHDMRQQLR